MKKQLFIAAGILVACIVIAGALISRRPAPPQRPAEVQTPLVQTIPADVRTGALLVNGAGTVRPRAEVALAAEVSGKVVYVNPALVSGSYVREGDVLVRLEATDYRNAVEQARADVAQQEVSVIQAEEEAELARSEYAQFQNRQQQRVADATSNSGSDSSAGEAGAAQTGQSDFADDQTPRPPSRLVFREPQLRAAQAALERARAQLASAELNLSRTVIRAPFSGYVRSKSVATGTYVSPGQSFAQLVASDVLEVSMPLTRDEATLIPDLWAERGTANIAATLRADYGGFTYQWEGYVDRAEAVLDPETRTINVVVRAPDPISGGRLVSESANASDTETSELGRPTTMVPTQPPPLLVGEFVRVSIEGASLDRYLVVPRGALRPDDQVWAVRDGSLRIIPVQVIQQVDDRAVVLTDALEDGDRIVVSPLSVATEGMKVRTSGESPPPATGSPDSTASSTTR